ncbi:NADH-quinone oxidoreductase subunit NuoE [Heliophilum fasciatum]|uniref:NADH-quinone oxidoreductase subunit E n=1 Tax=Heliophilum fasciatum TaxID=35700 RepID=A0A4R2RZ42_9FIRM|nr:NADH-quinone oxidoreductase subunit NuoE [Heliophilum fasciatum]MCW2276716.1 NADH-quinone oxidoreductase subunit E [Heliophilum fasciatum]TCP68903.1 NADH-quinone oxidoreductase subunit E [Heliophilum fasciatum]
MNCNCGGTAESTKDAALATMLAEYREKPGALIPVLQGAQAIYGYLPETVLAQIAAALHLPLSHVFGVVTFYTQFHLQPRGRHIIRVCLGTACHVRGGAAIFTALQQHLDVNDGETTEDQRFTLESVACIGACGLAPVITINDDTFGRLTPEQLPEILARYA